MSPLSCPAWFLFQLFCSCSQLTCPRVWSLLSCLASRPLSPVLPELSRLTCQANLSRLICLGYPVQRHSWCHVPDVMPQLYCYGCHSVPSQLSCPNWPVLLLCSCHPVLSFFSCLYHPDILWLSCPGCPAPAFLSLALFPRYPVFVVMLSLPCPICLVQHVLSWMPCLGCPALNVLSWLSRAVLTWPIKMWRIYKQMKEKTPFLET